MYVLYCRSSLYQQQGTASSKKTYGQQVMVTWDLLARWALMKRIAENYVRSGIENITSSWLRYVALKLVKLKCVRFPFSYFSALPCPSLSSSTPFSPHLPSLSFSLFHIFSFRLLPSSPIPFPLLLFISRCFRPP